MNQCISGKRTYGSQEVAEDALIEAWTRFKFAHNNGPVAVYRCDDCGEYHLTSQGPVNPRLAQAIAEGKIQRQQEADRWTNKLKHK